MKHQGNISQLTLEEKCYLLSGKDFWQSRSVKAKGVPNMTLSDGPHGIRKQEGAGDQLGLNDSVPAICFPTAATVANSWDPELGELIGHFLGTEAAIQDGASGDIGFTLKASNINGLRTIEQQYLHQNRISALDFEGVPVTERPFSLPKNRVGKTSPLARCFRTLFCFCREVYITAAASR